MRKVGFLLGAVVLLALALAPAFAAQPFSDVPQDHWAYNAIEKLAADGLIEGYPNGTFGGKRTMTRYEFAVALARLMERVESMQAGGVGPPGPQGAQGPVGPVGPPGPGITAEQQALLNRLATEFEPELANLRSEMAAINNRLTELEGKLVPAAGPSVLVTGNINWRTGVYGTKLGFENVDTTGYSFLADSDFGGGTAFGVIPTIFGDIPISDALKDSFKAGDFMTMRTRLGFAGNISTNTSAYVQILAGPTTNIEFPERFGFTGPSPAFFSGNGLMDTLQFDQIWLKHGTRFITPVELTIGKQYLRRGVGLLFDNDQEAIKALRADFGTGSLRLGALLGMLDFEQFFGRTSSPVLGVDPITGDPLETNGQDNINLFYLDFALFRDWRLGGNYLHSGFNKERGWSASLTGPFFGLSLYGEWSKLTRWPTGENTVVPVVGGGVLDLDESDNAWLAGLKWSNNWIGLQGEYGRVDPGYAFAFTGGGWDAIQDGGFFNLPLSALHPRAEIDPHDINWIDRPLFLDPTNIAKGWHVQATFPALLGKTALTASYATGDAYAPAFLDWLALGGPNSGLVKPADEWRDADPVWWVKLSRQMSDAVTASLLYGRREAENVLSPQTTPLPGTTTLATNDALQVIRAEVSVSF